MINKKRILIGICILSIGILFLELTSARSFGQPFSGSSQGSYTSVNYGSAYDFNRYYASEGRLRIYWPQLTDKDSCTARQDILIQVSPAGCQPAVVRSDLLEEQNVAVFCQLDALQFNPLVDVKQIRNIRFKGDYPDEVVGVGFHPARAALRTRDKLLGSPLINNIGYVVVVLKRQESERNMPDFVNFTLTANLDYYSGNALGTGRSEFLLNEVSEQDWAVEQAKQSFFNGKYSLRLLDSTQEYADIAIYHQDRKISSLKIDKGKSRDLYVPGSYCQTSLKVNYDGLVSSPDKKATLKIDEDRIEVWEGSKFLNGKCRVLSIEGRGTTNSSLELRCGREKFELSIKAREGNEGVDTLVDVHYNDTIYFDKSKESYLELVEQFPNEKQLGAQDIEGSESFAERGLDRAIDLALDYNKEKTAAELIDKYLEVYPDGIFSDKHKTKLASLLKIDYGNAGEVVRVDNDFKFIKLISIEEPEKKSSAKISWGSVEEVEEGDSFEFAVGKITLDKVYSAEKVKVTTYCSERKSDGTINFNKDKPYILRLNAEEGESSCGEVLRLNSVDLKEVARVRVSSVVRTSGETNFTVGVGIEKRAIELNPEKSRQKIDNLNETIKKWESISENLGEVVKGLKGACFATAGILTVKNFFTGLSGEALARQQVMRGQDGWTEYCKEAVNANPPEFVSMTQCYNSKASEISKDVNARAKAIAETNNLVKEIEESHVQSIGGFFGGNVIDTEGAADSLTTRLLSDYRDEIVVVDGQEVLVSELVKQDSYKNNEISYQELRDLYTNLRLRENGDFSRGVFVEGELTRIGNSVDGKTKLNGELSRLNNQPNIPNPVVVEVEGQTNIRAPVKSTPSEWDSLGKSYVATVVTEEGSYALGLEESSKSGVYTIEKVMEVKSDNSLGSERDKGEFVQTYQLGSVKSISAGSYSNKFAPGEAVVKYYETEPYKGMPAIVPIDEEQGWYVATRQTLPGFGNIKAFESNGRPASFWVCNIMEDKKVGFFSSGFGGDECVQFNLNTGQPLDQFPVLGEQRTRQLVNKAIDALNDASRQTGKKAGEHVNILGKAFEVAAPAAYLPGTQCQDYMSPEDCKLLFNVCDPVICPSSRCNLGGTYYVSDVIQTGIVGSALLCLPNIQEGIVMPVCLTGIKAGIDGYLSILKQHQACLQENLESGRTVGICDMITSVYTCEFFWRQAAPVANVLLPKIVEYSYYGGRLPARGGGEYLTVANAWDNAQGSVNYFTQSYAVNSLEAFKIRSVEEAGSQVCRAWISLKGPKSFETLIEPDSPSQFHAWFSSIPFSDATVPATAQYKVFYHIFAGNDAGVSYSVYLKDPPEGTYYSPPTVNVATGFVPKGESVSETADFTFPAGYQQLCVRINNKEECGFKQVSSSFALNYLRDEFLQDELDREDIASERACVSGSLNAAALLTPNIQEAAQEAIDPAVYNRGIVRICATSNPGEGSDPTRFKKVGYCDDPAVGCWLDEESIDKAYTAANVGIRNASRETFEGIRSGQEVFSDAESLVGDAQVSQKLENLNVKADRIIASGDTSDVQSLLTEFNEAISWATFNHDKAWLMFSKADFYERLWKKLVEPRNKEPIDASEPPAEEAEGEEVNELFVGLTLHQRFPEEDPGSLVYFLFVDENMKNVYFDSEEIYAKMLINEYVKIGNYISGTGTILVEERFLSSGSAGSLFSEETSAAIDLISDKNYNDIRKVTVAEEARVA